MGRLTKGFVLIDVLSALLIATVAILLTLSSIALAARTAKLAKERVIRLISTRNENVDKRETVFFSEKSEKPEDEHF
jgi:competence protein ComGC